MPNQVAILADVLHFLADPGDTTSGSSTEYVADGLLLIEEGHVQALGRAGTMLPQLSPDVDVIDHRGKLLVPGFIDCHVHSSQINIIASYGEQLLDWLECYAFPAEQRFADEAFAEESAAFFVKELLRNGTTTALVFPTVHAHSVEALFSAALQQNMRLVSGKVLMDTGCPQNLRDDPESAYTLSRRLIEKWHGKGRLGYAITPRFAVTSSDRQLAATKRLAKEFPDVHVHTHLAENVAEIAMIEKRFGERRSYFDVYDYYGLARERTVFAHCLHIDNADRIRLAATGSAVAFCPSSNLFLGSGLFDLSSATESGIRVGIGSDVGGGTSLNMLRTLSDGYKVLQLQAQNLEPFRALYLATLGGAKALRLDDHIGNFLPGREADFVILDNNGSAVTAHRLRNNTDLGERLFALMMLGDDRNVTETWVFGQRVCQRDLNPG